MQYSLSIGMSQGEIAKIFEVLYYTVIRWIKEHSLKNLFNKPEDDNVIENYLQEVMNTYLNLGELCTRVILLNKGIKLKLERLRIILKRLKQSQPITMSTIRC